MSPTFPPHSPLCFGIIPVFFWHLLLFFVSLPSVLVLPYLSWYLPYLSWYPSYLSWYLQPKWEYLAAEDGPALKLDLASIEYIEHYSVRAPSYIVIVVS